MILLLWLGCAPRPAPPPAVVQSRPGAAPHGAAALAARDAVVMGDLLAFQRAIGALGAEFPLAAWPPEAQAEALLAVAKAGGASDIPAAATALGQLAVACGACHTVTGATIPLPTTMTPTGDGIRAEMKRHDRALDLVWRGLVGPSEQALETGAKAFRASTLSAVSGIRWEMAVVLDETASTLAQGIAEVEEPTARAALFGGLLATCSACHSAAPPELTEPE